MQEWVKHEGQRIIVVFEGRDGAGKGGLSKAITERVSPRVFCGGASGSLRTGKDPDVRRAIHAALPRCRWDSDLRSELVITGPAWKTSWACTKKKKHRRFLKLCPLFEESVVDAGIRLIKFWLEGLTKQERRSAAAFRTRYASGS